MSVLLKGVWVSFSRRSVAYLCRDGRSRCMATKLQISPVNITTFRSMSSIQQQFEGAKTKLASLSVDPGNQAKLQLYGLFKQATMGKITTQKPGVFDMVGRAKWEAWNTFGDMSKDEAMKKYIDHVNELAGAEQPGPEVTASTTGKAEFEGLAVSVDEGLRVIKFNRPEKKNAITTQMYDDMVAALKEAADDKQTVITVLTGEGDYYCSGNDLSNFTNISPDNIPQLAELGGKRLKEFVAAFIDFPKPLVAVVNGPAIGVSTTVLSLFDAVYASDRATFQTPFSLLGQSPEGCSSFTFPMIMGPGKASEMLFFNKKITSQQACDWGLVTEVFPDHSLHSEVWPKLKELAKLPIKSLFYSKKLVRDLNRDILHKVNDAECTRLVERWQSEDCFKAVMDFFSKRSKM